MKKGKRLLAAMLAGFLGLSTGLGVAVSAEEPGSGEATSEFQMGTKPERIPLNNISGTARVQSLNQNWKFYLGTAGGAEAPDFNDSEWRTVNVPHDYSIEQAYSPNMEQESGFLPGGTGWYRKTLELPKEAEGKRIYLAFDGVYMNATVWVNGRQMAFHPYGYTPFTVDITDAAQIGKNNTIAVRVEHKPFSSRWYSGSGIYRSVDLVLKDPVHVDEHGVQILTPDLETEAAGTVHTTLKTTVVNDSAETASVKVIHKLYHKGALTGAPVAQAESASVTVSPASSAEAEVQMEVSQPDLWTLENPALYTFVTEVVKDGKTLDTENTDYGFRYFNFDKNTGFSLNGKKMKLKGVCMHHDQGGLGSADYYRAIERQIEILQDMGVNSIRVTHNPASRNLIDICNKKGILLIEEIFDTWEGPKNGNNQDYGRWFNKTVGDDNHLLHSASGMTWAEYDLKQMVRRGRTSPAIIMWSLGNELLQGKPWGSNYGAVMRKMIGWTQEVDESRKVTFGDDTLKNNAVGHGDANAMAAEINKAGGVVGLNYADEKNAYDVYKNSPYTIYGSETASSVNSRGIYDHANGMNTPLGTSREPAKAGKTADFNLTSYDYSMVGWGALASEAWYNTIIRDYVAGEYVWTGFDYLGEPTPWNGTGVQYGIRFPQPKNSYFGIIDTAGFPKDSFYFYQSQWNEKVHTLHMLPVWDQNMVVKNRDVPIVVYTDAPQVKLFLTKPGEAPVEIGHKKFETKDTDAGYTYQLYTGADKAKQNHFNLYFTWYKKFEPGVLEVKAYDKNGTEITSTVGRKRTTTQAAPASLRATADRKSITADGYDLSYVTIDVLDENGELVENASNEINVKVSGNGTLLALDNGVEQDMTPYSSPSRKARAGKLLAIVRSTKEKGGFTLTAEAAGLQAGSVQVNSVPAEGSAGSEKQLESIEATKTYYVKVGHKPVLPETVTGHYTDGSEEQITVTWEEIAPESYSKPGSFQVTGTLPGKQKLIVNVSMVEEIGQLLNYSAMTPVGQVPELPASRPVVMPDAKIPGLSFDVTWEKPDAAVYQKTGTVVIPGKARAFGKEIPVTATIRVAEPTATLGENIAHLNKGIKQSIPEDQWSDDLASLTNGSTAMGDPGWDGTNHTCWSNYRYSQGFKKSSGDTKVVDPQTECDLDFSYNTQYSYGRIVIYFAKDEWSAQYPDPNKIKLFVSDDDKTWTPLEATETIGENQGKVKPYTYDFKPTLATYIRLHLVNAAEGPDPKRPSCICITEVEMYRSSNNIVTYQTTDFESLKVNGQALTPDQLTAEIYKTPAHKAVVEAVTKENAALTILPEFEDAVRLVLEAEDHSKRRVFTIQLRQNPDEDLPADDSSRDYPRQKTNIEVYSEQKPQDKKENALDDNPNTLWHSDWNATLTADQRWVILILDTPQKIDALRYLSRNGESNGRVGQYRVEVSSDKEHWTTVAESKGENEAWENTPGWKIAEFKPVVCKYVRLWGVTTYVEPGHPANRFMSAAELRVRLAPETFDLTEEGKTTVTLNPEKVTAVQVDAAHPAKTAVTVVYDGKTLEEDVDYTLTWADNTAPGTGKVTITGIQPYTGSLEKTFEIAKAAVTGITVKTPPTKTEYEADQPASLAGLVLEVTYDSGDKVELAYSEDNKDLFTVEPATIKADTTKLTVTYAGKTVEIPITVKKGLDGTQLAKTVTEAQNLDTSKATPEELEELQVALKEAEAIQKRIADKDLTLTQEEINKANERLEKAIKAIKEEEPTPPPAPPTPTPVDPTPTPNPILPPQVGPGYTDGGNTGHTGDYLKGDILRDPKTGITLEVLSGKLPGTVRIVVVSGPTKKLVKVEGKEVEAIVYDVKLQDTATGEYLSPDSDFSGMLTLPLQQGVKDVPAIYLDGEGKVTLIPSVIRDGKISFRVTHFSYYGYLLKAEGLKVPRNRTGIPATGEHDSLQYVILLLAGAIALGGISLGRRRKFR